MLQKNSLTDVSQAVGQAADRVNRHAASRAARINKRARVQPVRVIVLSFLALIAVGSGLLCLPFATPGRGGIPLLDAVFTVTSATCVTGLVVYDTYTEFTVFGRAVILLMIQVGGLGFVTFSTFFNLLLGRRLHFSRMQLASENGGFSGVAQTGRLIRLVMRITFATEGLGFLLLCPVLAGRYGLAGVGYSLFVAVSAYCNAGFDLFGFQGPFSSLTGFAGQPYVLGVVAALIVAGGLGFLVWGELLDLRRTRRLSLHTRLVLLASAGLLVLGTAAFALPEWNNPATLGPLSVGDKLVNSLFQSVSTRTAGFNSVDLASCRSLTKLLMCVLMFIGAAPGGTGGGVKVTTVAVLLVTVNSVIHGQQEASLFGRRIEKTAVYRALAVVTLGVMAVLLGVPFFYYGAVAPVEGIDCLFESVSAFATVGLSVGVTARMGTAARLAAIVLMFMGRLGPVSFAYFFARRQHDGSGGEILPESHIMVG